MPTIFYLLRHAHTTPSPVYAPNFDWPLDERGHAQAAKLVPMLEDLEIDVIASSPQHRALQTVTPFSQVARLPILQHEGLRESGFNQQWTEDFEGLVRAHWADLDYRRDGCESHRHCQQRVVDALMGLAGTHAGKTLLCASGGQAITLTRHHCDASVGYDQWAGVGTPDIFRLFIAEDHLEWDADFEASGLATIQAT